MTSARSYRSTDRPSSPAAVRVIVQNVPGRRRTMVASSRAARSASSRRCPPTT
jgi:hypothetical protein